MQSAGCLSCGVPHWRRGRLGAVGGMGRRDARTTIAVFVGGVLWRQRYFTSKVISPRPSKVAV